MPPIAIEFEFVTLIPCGIKLVSSAGFHRPRSP